MTEHRLRHPTARPSAFTHVSERGGRLRRWRRRMRAAIPFSAEQQFRLLQAALKIQLRSEGKPEDALTLRRPDNLLPPPGTPVRQPRRDSLYARNADAHQALHSAPAPKEGVRFSV
jgi:hypothetical protein